MFTTSFLVNFISLICFQEPTPGFPTVMLYHGI